MSWIPFRVRCGALAGAMFAGCKLLFGDPDDLTHGTVEPVNALGIGAGRLAPADPPPIQFAVIGDYGAATQRERDVSEMIHRWQPDFVITVGDNNYGSLAPGPDEFESGQTDWSRLVGDYYGDFMLGRVDNLYPEQSSATQRFFPTPGNHDNTRADGYDHSGGSPGVAGYLEYFFKNQRGWPRLPTNRGAIHTDDISYYALRRSPVDFFMLDSEPSHTAEDLAAERAWLESQLEASTATWKFAAFHHSPFSSSAHGDHAHMQWPELTAVSAIFCGHDHVYERLVYAFNTDESAAGNGPPIFISGLAGGGSYGFYDVKPQSRFRFDTYGGALRVLAGESGAVFQFRAFDPDQQIEELVEEFRLGGTLTDESDDFSFFGEAGLTAHFSTVTPPPLGNPPLDPAIDLFAPNGGRVASATGGASDGRNASLDYVLTATWLWRVRVRAEGVGAGPYQLRVRLENPSGGLDEWIANNFGAPGDPEAALDADPDHDGVANAVEYALGRSPWFAEPDHPIRLTVGTNSRLEFDVPAPLPLDFFYSLEMSDDLSPSSWIPVAQKASFQPWVSAASVSSFLVTPDRQRIEVTLPFTSAEPRRFFRLRVVPNSP